MVRMRGVFHECEHSGDMERYIEDVRKAGGTVLWSQVNGEIEVGTMEIEVRNVDAFKAAFAKTDSVGFGSFQMIVQGSLRRGRR